MLQSEMDLLNPVVRKHLIEGFESDANQIRKAEAFKGYECLKDKTVTYVLGLLLKQFSESTVSEMQYAMSNISILRKVIEKLARVYANGVKRSMPTEADTAAIEEMAELVGMTPTMKKTNRYFKTFKNTLAYVRPYPIDLEKFGIKVESLPPFHYDVVEQPGNPEAALAIVLSDYSPKRPTLYTLGDASTAGRTGVVKQMSGADTEAKLMAAYSAPTGNQHMAGDAPKDAKRYIWWTKNFHFTTNAKGEILGGEEGNVNPIGALPFVNFAGERDGQFYSEGGYDLIDAGVKINTLITNVIHVAISQGYGQLYMTGKNLPKSVTVGPNHCVQLEYNKDEDPSPTIGYLNSNPPIEDLKGLIEMYVALMLTTNNLSTSGFNMSLEGGSAFASGVALMIDKAESIEDTSEQAALFVDNEPRVWGLLQKWHEVYASKGLLAEEFAAIPLPKNAEEVQIAFPSMRPVLSELDQLAILEKRRELGLNTEIEILMRDDPSLSEKEAEAKLAKILEEKMNRMAQAMVEGPDAQGDESGGDAKPDDDDAPNPPRDEPIENS